MNGEKINKSSRLSAAVCSFTGTGGFLCLQSNYKARKNILVFFKKEGVI
jgi:hypothetical protein